MFPVNMCHNNFAEKSINNLLKHPRQPEFIFYNCLRIAGNDGINSDPLERNVLRYFDIVSKLILH